MAGSLLMMIYFVVVVVVLAETAVVVVFAETVVDIICAEDNIVVVFAESACGAEDVLVVFEGAEVSVVPPEGVLFEGFRPVEIVVGLMVQGFPVGKMEW